MKIYLLFLCCFISQYNFSQKSVPKGSKPLPSRTVIDAAFPGDMKLFNKYLHYNLYWPDSENDITGEIVMSYTIGVEGFVTEAKLVKNDLGNFGEQLAIEAARALRKSPMWQPATLNGKKVPITKLIALPYPKP
ncbi:energy transducer TonB [Flavobacterium wongokense]|uniref:energy transducer TonB n=1 Tax=Flavobacterium wongokense TaxID=2910674 RepID=UPI001F306021|nr:energy transducer TonB [Flavobacterium sp. WG47]MCF6132504.1 energy transducer TonB [Flavobacterium sp. WG47]